MTENKLNLLFVTFIVVAKRLMIILYLIFKFLKSWKTTFREDAKTNSIKYKFKYL